MTVRLQRARPGSPELQALVDELAERLGRSVAVDDPLVRMVCTSRHFGDEDPVRIGTLLQGRADNAAIRYVLAQGVTRWSRPGFIDGRDDLGLLPRYVVPLCERGHLLGLLVVVVPEKTLGAEEIAAIARAADAMSAQMYGEHIAADTRKTDERDLALALVGADVLTVDLRGHGRSGTPRHGYRIARLSRDVLELVDRLGLDRFDALGWSMGVSVWWSFIDQYGTGRIRRFVAVDQPAAVAAVPLIGCEGSHVHPDSQRFVAERIPGARLHVFASDVASSHFPFPENPPAFNAVVEKFLAEEPARGA
ncbi:alpha/beta fold hydrolase [Streptomyces sp. NPDC051286]|uniref:alpha/beta fold hydrolase n=1 Tax=Streptomyces sp. NPDC051286 TaxID=3365647 RepID=UPI003799CE9E